MNQQAIGTVEANVAILQAAIFALFSVVRDKDALKLAFQKQSDDVLEEALRHPIGDDALASARALQKAFLRQL